MATTKAKKINQEQGANFRGKNGKLYLVRCYACGDKDGRGRENWAPAVASGTCAWCGWSGEEKGAKCGEKEKRSRRVKKS